MLPHILRTYLQAMILIYAIQFQIGPDQRLPAILRTYQLKAPNKGSDPLQLQYNYRDTWCMSEMSARHVVLKGRDRKYFPPPDARFVGIYVSCEQPFNLGALLSQSTDVES